MTDIVVTLLNEKVLINGRVDKFEAPLQFGDKVIAIEANGGCTRSYYIGTTPSGKTHKVLELGSSNYFTRPYKGVLKYDWKLFNPKDEEYDEITKNVLATLSTFLPE